MVAPLDEFKWSFDDSFLPPPLREGGLAFDDVPEKSLNQQVSTTRRFGCSDAARLTLLKPHAPLRAAHHHHRPATPATHIRLRRRAASLGLFGREETRILLLIRHSSLVILSSPHPHPPADELFATSPRVSHLLESFFAAWCNLFAKGVLIICLYIRLILCLTLKIPSAVSRVQLGSGFRAANVEKNCSLRFVFLGKEGWRFVAILYSL